MATVSNVGGSEDGCLVGLKIEVGPEILHRDYGIGGNKIFTLIPENVRTVRSFKKHLMTNVLKTHTPFYFYNGDFRIPDENDIRIFNLLTEPCRILPVPQPKSVLSNSSGYLPAISSTPVDCGNGPSLKRVKFTEDLSSFEDENGDVSNSCATPDQVDNRSCQFLIEDNVEERSTLKNLGPTLSKSGKRLLALEGEGSETSNDETPKKKRKRRRTHKSKKHSKETDSPVGEIPTDANLIVSDTTGVVVNGKLPKIKKDKLAIKAAKTVENNVISPKKKSKVLPDYDADESELCQNQSLSLKENGSSIAEIEPQKNSVNILMPSHNSRLDVASTSTLNNRKNNKLFLSPNTALTGYPSLRNSSSASGLDTISFNSSNGSPIPIATSTVTRRQDTPCLPRVLKNPCTNFQFVKRNLSFKSGREELEKVSEDNGKKFEESDKSVKTISSSCVDLHERNISLDTTKEVPIQKHCNNGVKIVNAEEIKVGDTISFKLVELNENYTPVVSSLKEARVIEKNGSMLSFEYTKNEIKQRNGAYEIEDEELTAENLDDISRKSFAELLEPELISRNEMS